MKKLILSMSMSAATIFSLTACGGGVESPTTTNSSNVALKFYDYGIGYFQVSADADKHELAVAKLTTTIDSGVLYQQKEYLAKNAKFVVESERSDEYQNEFLLTRTAFYEPDYTRYPQGYRQGLVQLINDKQLVFSPNGTANNQELISTLTRKQIDLSGKKISDFLFLGETVALIKPVQNSIKKFPQGALCWQNIDTQTNKDVLIFSTYKDDDSAQITTLAELIAEANEFGLGDDVFKVENWFGIPWASYTTDSGNTHYYVQPKDELYNAYLTKASTIDPYGRKASITRLEEALKTASVESAIALRVELNEAKNSCDDFNQVAADTIDVVLASIQQ